MAPRCSWKTVFSTDTVRYRQLFIGTLGTVQLNWNSFLKYLFFKIRTLILNQTLRPFLYAALLVPILIPLDQFFSTGHCCMCNSGDNY